MTTLSVRGLRKRFGERVALDDVNLQVEPGEVYGFVGANGAGKTTTMRVILGVLAPDAGEVLIDGRAITGDDRTRIGYMPSERGLYPKMHVRDQLVYLARLHGLDKPAAQQATETWTERLGVAERLDDEIGSLSLGNQQRVQLAAALVHSPNILVLDEPFSGLDPMAVEVMSTVLTETASGGVPVLFSSHQLDLVERVSHRVGIIRNGAIIAQGTVAELRAKEPVRYRIGSRSLSTGWTSGITGAVEQRTDEHGSEVLIDSGTQANSAATERVAQQLLNRALASGPVTEFSPIVPTLTELFREAVAA